MIKRALISVSDKTGIVELAEALHRHGVQLISTGGTARLLAEAGLPVKEVAEVTGFPECLDGRVKTLHPVIHGGLLARRPDPAHMNTLAEMHIDTIDLLVINLYPFKETMLRPGATFEEVIEQIDIGGPAMLRSAAKNHESVTVLTDPADYPRVLQELAETGDTTPATRRDLAAKVFQLTSHYDSLIAGYLTRATEPAAEELHWPATMTLTFEKAQDLRYGENPHQQAAFYREPVTLPGTLAAARQLQGKELSFNNINDAAGTLSLLQEFTAPTAVAVKHTNPCGVASGETIEEAWEKAYGADPLSIFGGIVAFNRPVTETVAKGMLPIFLEVVMAPAFTPEALQVLAAKPNIRLLEIPEIEKAPREMLDLKRVPGGLLVQQADDALTQGLDLKTTAGLAPELEEDLRFAWKIVKHVKSNAIVIAKNQQTLAVGPGQTSRIWALENALRNTTHDTQGAVMASDAFFPFSDCVEVAAQAGITAIIQPGGSQKDQESIDACNRLGIAMVFTGMRHFKH
ncbi:bifunctional phosphoribosylaminoimidazolecarboxamide formyltransferase/IMP cyclohydrolase [Anoxynatronum buryatiense]|uniref:Bifunctional purine biosynthesis protein PurH n=1 Tax=Anoxynatronum buryatiense TaxID=489973 RepID=A0AA45WWI7_9CLOT|nr:bifunctional phosphoribosylaminoimidazolecarboxamide formyltransferase/IMP cyclohydrolase [Anoxynatronum buryatiense]SMP59937.1 IMP cyclohydrolase /phosphoribosylaminoimidazolecarboxamide formyltransferase [Anoxynatronum buryatiense]